MKKLQFRTIMAAVVLLVTAVSPVVTSAVNSAPGVGDGLVAQWKFEEGSGNVVKDSSSNHNDGTIIGASAPKAGWGAGNFAGSISFSGTNGNHVRIPASASLNKLTTDITVVANVYPRTLWAPRPRWAFWADKPTRNGYIPVVQRQWKTTSHPDLFYLGFGPKNRSIQYKWHLGLVGDENDNASLYCLPESGDKPSVEGWVHLAGTYNGETGKMSLYVNGALICTRTILGKIRMDSQSEDRPLVIGAELNGPNIDEATNEFDGYVDEVRVYDRALSDREINALAVESKKRTPR